MKRGAQPDQKKEAHWRRLVGRQARSGLSARAWCRQHGQRESAFYWWRAELSRRDRATDHHAEVRPIPATFVPVRVVEEAATSIGDAHDKAPATEAARSSTVGRIEIVLPRGRRVRVLGRVDRAMLADVVAVLEGPPC